MLSSRADSGFLFLLQGWLCTVPMLNSYLFHITKRRRGRGRTVKTVRKKKNTRTGERRKETEREEGKKERRKYREEDRRQRKGERVRKQVEERKRRKRERKGLRKNEGAYYWEKEGGKR